MDLILAIFGLGLLFLAGDLLVKGAVAAGLRTGIPPFLIGLTIVAFGTSAPELFVTVKAWLANAPGVAVGNVVGSNIANVLLVLGLPALLAPMGDDSSETRRTYVIMIGVTVITVGLFLNAPLTWWQGGILLTLLFAFLYDSYRCAMVARDRGENVPDPDEVDDYDPDMAAWKIPALIVVGTIGLVFGADLTLEGARGVAEAAGMSDEAIGLTLVALGTSLPELATTVMAAIRSRADVAIGNVIGSNVFNLLAVLGLAASLGEINVPAQFLNLNMWVMLASAAALAPFVFSRRKVGKVAGGAFLAAYVAYIGFVLAPTTL